MEIRNERRYVHGTTTLLTKLANAIGIKSNPIFITAQGDGGPSLEAVEGRIGMYYDGMQKVR